MSQSICLEESGRVLFPFLSIDEISEQFHDLFLFNAENYITHSGKDFSSSTTRKISGSYCSVQLANGGRGKKVEVKWNKIPQKNLDITSDTILLDGLSYRNARFIETIR